MPRWRRAQRRDVGEVGQETDLSKNGVEAALSRYAALPIEEHHPPSRPHPAVAFPSCQPPADRTPPSFVVPYRQSILIDPIPVSDVAGVPLKLGSVAVGDRGVELNAGVSVTLEQRFNLVGVALGDLASVMALAPAEDLTLEFTQSQRKVLDSTTVDSVESLQSDESTTLDKEVMDVARASSRTQNWHVDASGSYGIGDSKIGASAGTSTTVSDTSQSSIQQLSQTTRKSANSLKTLKKIEVRGVSDGFTQTRMTRKIHNPYRDRTLTVNVFQLVKHFSVITDLAETRLALFIDVSSLNFDADFVVAHGDFLQDNLLDPLLLDELPLAIAGALPEPPAQSQEAADGWAERALALLFDEPNVFDMPPIVRVELGGPLPVDVPMDPNPPETSFDARILPGRSGLDDALRNELGTVFASLGLFYRAYRDLESAQLLRPNAVALALAIAGDVGPKWTAAKPADVTKILDGNDFTEIFRRLPGFLAIASLVLTPLVQPAAAELANIETYKNSVFVLGRLLSHLNSNKNFYIQMFLTHLATTTKNQTILDFVREVVDRAGLPSDFIAMYDIESSFVSAQQIVVPGLSALPPGAADALIPDGAGQGETGVIPAVDDLEVPADGIHLEVAAGSCILDDLPPTAATTEISLEGASLRVTGSGDA
jgi:hypothetical protein